MRLRKRVHQTSKRNKNGAAYYNQQIEEEMGKGASCDHIQAPSATGAPSAGQ